MTHKNVLCKKLDTKLYVLCVNILRRLFQNHRVTQDVGGGDDCNDCIKKAEKKLNTLTQSLLLQ